MSNQKFKNALNNQAQSCPPIWFMRQAGRYHDHYQNLKKTYTFEQLCKTPELAAQTALGPIDDFDFDVSILFSDILFPLEALGFDLAYNPGPQLAPKLDQDFLSKLKPFEEAHDFLKFQSQAVKATRELLPADKSLIGFVGGPWTLFTYALEGVHKGHLIDSKKSSDLYFSFCETMVPLLSACVEDQLNAGAEIIMIFDTSAGELSSFQYRQYILPTITKLAMKHPGKVGYYCKGTTFNQIDMLAELPLAGLGFDHRYDLSQVLMQRSQKKGFTQGNFDQSLLFSDPAKFKSLLHDFFAPIKELSQEERKGWVCGLGHGVLPKTPQENVKQFIHTVREIFS